MSTTASGFEFPCQFPIKVIGLANPGFDFLVTSILNKHVDKLDETTFVHRLSKNGKYLSITITIEAIHQNQLDNIYRELSAHEQVIMAL